MPSSSVTVTVKLSVPLKFAFGVYVQAPVDASIVAVPLLPSDATVEVRWRDAIGRIRNRQRPAGRRVLIGGRTRGAAKRRRVLNLANRDFDHLSLGIAIIIGHRDREAISAVEVRIRRVRPSTRRRINRRRAIAAIRRNLEVRWRDAIGRIRNRQRPAGRRVLIGGRTRGAAKRRRVLNLANRDFDHLSLGIAIIIGHRDREAISAVEVRIRRVRPSTRRRINRRRAIAAIRRNLEVRWRDAIGRIRNRQRPAGRRVLIGGRTRGAAKRRRVLNLANRDFDHLSLGIAIIIGHRDREAISAVEVRIRRVRPSTRRRINRRRAIAAIRRNLEVRWRDAIGRIRNRQRPRRSPCPHRWSHSWRRQTSPRPEPGQP